MSDISSYLSYMYSYPHKTAYRTFSPPLNISEYISSLQNKDASLYFHIPFCKYKCGFCNLFSLQTNKTDLVTAYLDALNREAEQLSALSKNLNFTSFAIGGGTPMFLSAEQLEKLFHTAGLFGVTPSNTFTSIETSPDYTDPDMLTMLKSYNTERISIGIQSFFEEELRTIKRGLKPEICHSALETISKIGFTQFNIDLIYGIAGQTSESFVQSIKTALTYNPTEIFIYPLYVRQGTGIDTKSSSDQYSKMYFAGRDELVKNGFTQTSMRRFVKTVSTDLEFSCGDETVISCGCGGRSYIGDLHTANVYAVHQKEISGIIESYINTEDFTKVNNGHILNSDEKQRRFIIKNLMHYKGIDKKEFGNRFNTNIYNYSFEAIIKNGFVEDNGERIFLTEKGLSMSDYVGQLFISEEIRKLMTEYKFR